MAGDFLIRKAGQPIISPEDWLRLAPPPEGESTWADGEPVREFARLFFDPDGRVQVPPVLAKMLTSHAILGSVSLQSMIPEYRIALDAMPGASQRCDAMAVGTSREGRVAVTWHARTEKGFGPLISDQLRRGKPGSQWAARASRLAEAVLGRPLDACGNLRGELLRLAAASLRAAEAEKAAGAVLVFHEFRPKAARASQLQGNAADLDAFVKYLGGKPLRECFLTGPFRVPGGNEVPASVPLYLGKITTLL